MSGSPQSWSLVAPLLWSTERQGEPSHCPQVPLAQEPLQQLAFVAQAAPLALQVAQEPLAQAAPLQHWELSAQAAPSFVQHCWLWGSHAIPPQQPEAPSQGSPTPPQCAQEPWVQTLEQQSLASAQVVSSPWQEPHLSL